MVSNEVDHRSLPPEVAVRLRSAYDFVVFAGVHGRVVDPSSEEAFLTSAPTQREYQQMANFVAGLQPGDVMLVERYGHHGVDRDEITTENLALMESLPDGQGSRVRDLVAQRVEAARQTYGLTAFDYGRYLAAIKGVHTTYADLTAQDIESGPVLRQLVLSADAQDQDDEAQIHSRRELAACRAAINWAAEHIDEAEVDIQ